MRYKDALAIGTSEGTIQCTYAIIYDAKGNKLFALQRKGFEQRLDNVMDLQQGNDSYQASTNFTSVTYTGHGAEGIVAWDDGSYLTNVETGYIVFDMPLVRAKQHSNDRLIPVTLLYDAIAYIKKTMASGKEINYWVYALYAPDGLEIEQSYDQRKIGTWIKQLETKYGTITKTNNDTTEARDITITTPDGSYRIIGKQTKGRNPRWIELANKLNDKDTFYVKPAAFNWQPINTENAIDPETGLTYSDKLKEAQKKYESAKALLIAAGATALL